MEVCDAMQKPARPGSDDATVCGEVYSTKRGVLLLNRGLDMCIGLVVRRVQRCERLAAGQADLPELLYASTGGAQVNSGYTAKARR